MRQETVHVNKKMFEKMVTLMDYSFHDCCYNDLTKSELLILPTEEEFLKLKEFVDNRMSKIIGEK